MFSSATQHGTKKILFVVTLLFGNNPLKAVLSISIYNVSSDYQYRDHLEIPLKLSSTYLTIVESRYNMGTYKKSVYVHLKCLLWC